jgi:hypothetical protein
MVGKTSLSSPVEELWPPTTTVKKYSSAGSPVAVLHKIEEGENLPTGPLTMVRSGLVTQGNVVPSRSEFL